MMAIFISADSREKDVIESIKIFPCIINEVYLETGDFIVSDRCVIERKTYTDFLASVYDGRIFEQVRTMKDNFEVVVILVEGTENFEEKTSDTIFKSVLASLILKFNVSILNTKNFQDTAKMIYELARKEQEENKREHDFNIVKKEKEIPEIRERLLSSLPLINRTKAKKLLEHFKTPEHIFSASEEELQAVEGIGKILSKKIREIITKEYL